MSQAVRYRTYRAGCVRNGGNYADSSADPVTKFAHLICSCNNVMDGAFRIYVR